MAKKLFVGNLSWSTTEDALRDAFGKFGTVASAQIIFDRMSGRSKGFGFVEFEDDAEAEAAISGLHGSEMDGREITVNEARPKEERPDRPPRRDYNR